MFVEPAMHEPTAHFGAPSVQFVQHAPLPLQYDALPQGVPAAELVEVWHDGPRMQLTVPSMQLREHFAPELHVHVPPLHVE